MENYILKFPFRSTLISSVMVSIQHIEVHLSAFLCQQLIHRVSQTVQLSIFALCLMVVSFSSPPPACQPTPTGLCHVAIVISPESELFFVILILCMPMVAHFPHSYSLDHFLSLHALLLGVTLKYTMVKISSWNLIAISLTIVTNGFSTH